jgi:hypothetical protein
MQAPVTSSPVVEQSRGTASADAVELWLQQRGIASPSAAGDVQALREDVEARLQAVAPDAYED